MIKNALIALVFLVGVFLTALPAAKAFHHAAVPAAKGEYTVIIDGYDWGPAVSKVVLSLDETVTSVNHQDYSVSVKRQTECVALPAEQASGDRRVVYAYVSDDKGNVSSEGKHVTLVLEVAPNQPLSSPIQYSRNEKCRGNNWLDYQISITHNSSKQTWNKEADRVIPLIDRFDLSGKYKHEDITMAYASFSPESGSGKLPLIIWLHGGGEGGTDPSIPLIANRAANYASDEIQALFGGAYVLSPQSPTYWMDNGEGSMTSGQTNDVYNEALMALIQKYVAENPKIDQDRIYLGGCSNGGYMTLKLLLLHPDYFAAAFPSALAYHSQYISDEQIESIKNIPIWFVHSKDDSTTVAKETVIPVYERLKSAGAEKVHLSLYDHVVDITGFFGGEDYHYPGHWSWIYSHANECRKDADGSLVKLDGRPTTIMEWMAAQKK
ncbi:prolyl oligopeptidase family serine peptidase [Catalinimonas niigatensis]|uniref:prolyl oligopeptidase family serine peptidase n=1 Tax=Catalinimonas niigatensis TaxID=1397264 RepID=UPI00266573F6|nr:prolyl oligopeptidase family serine peptidase [Catalinimonas niigatensis]WPP50977.1 prolyl oligopeptidase family serine peptidase [Catalinimonas niigatensis]